MRKLLLLFLLFSAKSYCQDFKWMAGKWKEDSGKSIETWVMKDSAWSGTGIQLKKDGTKSVSEEMTIVKKGNDYFFVSDVAGSQPAIDFKITSFDKNSFVAENLQHDFPKKISYKRMDENHLQAFISDGDKTIIRFYFTKVND